MDWIYLSPHFDDVALSCGGLVWEQVRNGDQVSIWTVCGGEAPEGELSTFAQELHARWLTSQNAPSSRRIEDHASCQRLGASPRYFSIPDCIYRRSPSSGDFMYASEAALNGDLHSGDLQTIDRIMDELSGALPPEAVVVCPLGLGRHVDHQLTRLVAEGLNFPLWYYADYPYVLRCKDQLEEMKAEGWSSSIFNISQEGLAAWQESTAAHASQISTFWGSLEEMYQAVAEYMRDNSGIRLWRMTSS